MFSVLSSKQVLEQMEYLVTNIVNTVERGILSFVETFSDPSHSSNNDGNKDNDNNNNNNNNNTLAQPTRRKIQKDFCSTKPDLSQV